MRHSPFLPCPGHRLGGHALNLDVFNISILEDSRGWFPLSNTVPSVTRRRDTNRRERVINRIQTHPHAPKLHTGQWEHRLFTERDCHWQSRAPPLAPQPGVPPESDSTVRLFPFHFPLERQYVLLLLLFFYLQGLVLIWVLANPTVFLALLIQRPDFSM